MKLEWERVEESVVPHLGELWRAKMEGGWLYERLFLNSQDPAMGISSSAFAFVPDLPVGGKTKGSFYPH